MYMAEALFVQKVSPWTPVGAVDVPALLATARRQLLRGATQSSPITTGNPRRGLDTWVHGRSGKPCQRCGTIVRVAPIGPVLKERPAFYCPHCQPGPTPTDDGKPRRPSAPTQVCARIADPPGTGGDGVYRSPTPSLPAAELHTIRADDGPGPP